MNLSAPWPWYIAGPLIGLTVPLLLLLGNKSFGISTNLRHLCAAILPSNKIDFFNYNWRSEYWNLSFVAGIIGGAALAMQIPAEPLTVHENLEKELLAYGITDYNFQLPTQLFNIENVLTLPGFIVVVVGGFLVGFGTRYAGGCTSGHAITGLSTLQLPSLIATISFMAGGILTANFVLPYILRL